MKFGATLFSVAVLAGGAIVASAWAQSPAPRLSEATSPFRAEATVYQGQDPLTNVQYLSRAGQVAYSPYGGSWNVGDPAIHAEEVRLSQESSKLVHEFQSADSDSKRDDLKPKLKEALGKQFDLRQKKHGKEIEALEAEVKKLKQLVAKRQENRDEIITRRYEQVVRESEGLGW